MSLVIIRCGGKDCNRVLATLDTMPTDWTGDLTVTRCRKCVIPRERRVADVLRRQGAKGFALQVMIPLADLRRHAEKAQRIGEPVGVTLRPWRKAL
jgi:hypothetical protein